MQEQTQPEQEPQNVTIQAYSLADALTELQRYVQKGYEVDVETNGTYPMLIGSLMLFSVVKKSTEVLVPEPTPEPVEAPTTVDTEELKETLEDLVEAAVEAVEASQTAAKRGRPKASA